jgi:membrane protein
MSQSSIRSEQPLYPKISSIYNKIMQLAIAIFLIIVLMNLWVFSYGKNQRATKNHFDEVSSQYLVQISAASTILLQKNKHEVEQYFNDVSQSPWIKDISLYDVTGQLIFATEQYSSINDLYGLSKNKIKRNDEFSTYVQEIRGDELIGYVRLTIKNNSITAGIEQASEQHDGLVRLMMILAVIVGFFLTRGLNRFSRQGFRLG